MSEQCRHEWDTMIVNTNEWKKIQKGDLKARLRLRFQLRDIAKFLSSYVGEPEDLTVVSRDELERAGVL